MDRTRRNLAIALAASLLAAGGSGCLGPSSTPSWMPFAHHPPEPVPGVDSPSERAAGLRKLAEQAPSMDAAQKGALALELVEQIKKEEDPSLRSEILRTLAVCGGPAADRVLRAALNDPDADVRMLACKLCGKHCDAEAVKALGIVVSADIDKDVRMAAVQALGSARDPSAIAVLGTALAEKDPAMQYSAVVSLRTVTGRDLGNDVDRWRAAVKDGSLKPADAATLAGRWLHWF
jgi:HEAT repeat protein